MTGHGSWGQRWIVAVSYTHLDVYKRQSIEYALVNWKMSYKFTLTAGKQDIALGGYEYYVNAIKVREYSEFNLSLIHIFLFSISIFSPLIRAMSINRDYHKTDKWEDK